MRLLVAILKCLGGIITSIIVATSCNEGRNNLPISTVPEEISIIEIPSRTVDLSALVFDRSISRWALDNIAYSGYCTSYFEDGKLELHFGILEGRKEGLSEYWYPDGHLKSSATYNQGKLHGEKKNWSPDSSHVLLANLNYNHGKGHGIQKKWYASGELFMVLNLNMGTEEGMQRAYRKNGDLYANYEAKKGRIFGMKKTQLCFGIENETVNHEGD